MKKNVFVEYGFLLFALLFYSGSSLCTKLSSQFPVFSIPFILLYGGSILILMVYAVLWQIILKRVDLSRAYATKPLTMILSMVWGVVLFHEALTWNMILGVVIILLGVSLAVGEYGE